MSEIQNTEITKVYEGTTGDWGYGETTAYNFYLKGRKEKFCWWKSENRPLLPTQGMSILLMEYEVEQKGEYTNYNVSKIVLHETKTTAKHSTGHVGQAPKSGVDSSITYYLGYSARFMSSLIANGSGWNEATPETIADLVVDMAKRMYDRTHDTATKEAEKGFVEPDNEPRQEPDFEPPPIEAYND